MLGEPLLPLLSKSMQRAGRVTMKPASFGPGFRACGHESVLRWLRSVRQPRGMGESTAHSRRSDGRCEDYGWAIREFRRCKCRESRLHPRATGALAAH
jgi:hypothetical protein